MNPVGRMSGFPAEYMPLQHSIPKYDSQPIMPFFNSWSCTLNSISKNGTLTLALPLDPSHHYEIEQEIRMIRGIPARGAELIARIAIRIHDNWRDTANRAISRRVHDSRIPFRNFEFITEPNMVPRAELTPFKIGIVYCWILNTVVESPDWPGRIIASIWDAIPGVERHALHVGTLHIQNSPFHVGAFSEKQPFNAASPFEITAIDKNASFQLSNHTTPEPKLTRGPSLTGATKSLDKNPIERRWFKCWSTAFFHALTFTTDEIVRDRWFRFKPIEPPRPKSLYIWIAALP